jgi:hypothetical protein
MKYIGNYKSWIEEQKIMEHLSACQGEVSPVWPGDFYSGHPILEKIKESGRAGYSDNRFVFHQLGPHSPEMANFKFELPTVPESRSNVNWWFVKLYPGEFQIMHIDPHTVEVTNLVRYTIFLQDWEPGHIFVWDNKYIADYKAGDMYEWSDPMSVHAPANIGYNTRYTFQMTLHN